MSDNLLKSTASVGSMTFISRILGFLRDMISAQIFGASAGNDAFLIAYKIPNFFRSLFAEGAFSQAFVPLLSQLQSNEQRSETLAFVNSITGCLALICFAVTIIGVLAAPIIISVFAPGFSPTSERYELAVSMLRITFPYLLFISLTALAGGILNTYNRFKVPAFTPALFNVSVIISVIFLAPLLKQPIYALAWGVFLGGIVQLIFQIPFLWQINLLPKLKPNFSNPSVKRLLKLMIPALFGVSIVQINVLIGTLFASFLPAGSVSWLYYADRLMQFPLGVFGVALATVILPNLSKRYAKQNEEAYRDVLAWSVGVAFIIGLPAVAGLYCLATPLIATLFKYGAFTANDMLAAANALQAYSIGIIAFILIKILAAAFYARQEISTPVKISAIGLVVNIVLSVIFIQTIAHVGLALATALSAVVNASALAIILNRRGLLIFNRNLILVLIRVFFSVALMISFIQLMQASLSVEWEQLIWYKRASNLLMLVTGGVVVYMSSMRFTGYRFADLQYNPEGS